MSIMDGINFWFALIIVKFLILIGIIAFLGLGLIVLVFLEHRQIKKRKRR